MALTRSQQRKLGAMGVLPKSSPLRLVDTIQHGDKVTIVKPNGQQFTGKAQLKSALGDNSWVLMHGKFGQFGGIASDENVVKVIKG